MYLIKQYFIINSTINKIIRLILKSKVQSYQIGSEISLLYYYINEDQKKDSEFNINMTIKKFISTINKNDYIIIKFLNPIINYNIFLEKFNKRILNLQHNKLRYFFRGYYINNLYLYGSNIQLCDNFIEPEDNINKIYYFVLYDFHHLYLEYIYSYILNKSKFPCKIKFLLKSSYDKYSINEITDDINYKLVFIHKPKYYNNSIKYIFNYLFEDIINSQHNSQNSNTHLFNNLIYLSEEDEEVYKLLSSFLL